MTNNAILEKLEGVKIRFEEVGQQLTNPDVISDVKRYISLNKEYRGLEPIIRALEEYKNVVSNIEGAKDILNNEKEEELREMAKAEMEELTALVEPLEEKINLLLLPADPQDDKNAILEIRAGTGGDEASIFAGDLYRMYTKYCENKGWKVEVTSASEGTNGGFKEVIMKVSGDKVYGTLKYESGVHRVQRVPKTETQGRIHTSAATVAVLPEADEFDVVLNINDVRKDTFCSSGPGGQSVNTTYSAIRLTHIPSGIVVQCQDEKSQIKNRDKAMRVLRARLQEIEEQKQHEALASERRSMVGSGDRSEKIRTYNFKENRVSDHRIGLTIHQLDLVMEGNLDPFIDALVAHYQAEKLKAEAVAA